MPDLITHQIDPDHRVAISYYPDLGGPVEIRWQERTQARAGSLEDRWNTWKRGEVPAELLARLVAQRVCTDMVAAVESAVDDARQELLDDITGDEPDA